MWDKRRFGSQVRHNKVFWVPRRQDKIFKILIFSRMSKSVKKKDHMVDSSGGEDDKPDSIKIFVMTYMWWIVCLHASRVSKNLQKSILYLDVQQSWFKPRTRSNREFMMKLRILKSQNGLIWWFGVRGSIWSQTGIFAI